MLVQYKVMQNCPSYHCGSLQESMLKETVKDNKFIILLDHIT